MKDDGTVGDHGTVDDHGSVGDHGTVGNHRDRAIGDYGAPFFYSTKKENLVKIVISIINLLTRVIFTSIRRSTNFLLVENRSPRKNFPKIFQEVKHMPNRLQKDSS